jgi:hypothetical protein
MSGRTSLHPNGVLEFGRLAIASVRSVPISNRLLVASAVVVVNCCRCKFAITMDCLWHRYPKPPGGTTRPEFQRRSETVVAGDAACIMVHLDGGIRVRNSGASSLNLSMLKRCAQEVVRLFSLGSESVGLLKNFECVLVTLLMQLNKIECFGTVSMLRAIDGAKAEQPQYPTTPHLASWLHRLLFVLPLAHLSLPATSYQLPASGLACAQDE